LGEWHELRNELERQAKEATDPIDNLTLDVERLSVVMPLLGSLIDIGYTYRF
jgi:hypothetical protein